jgi:hypothetical protein
MPVGTLSGVTLSRLLGLNATVAWTAFSGASQYTVTGATTTATVTSASATVAMPSGATSTLTVTATASDGVVVARGTLSVASPSSVLPAGQSLTRGTTSGTAMDNRAGTAIVSPDGVFVLYLQPDGNLVLYTLANGTPVAVASTATWGSDGYVATMQTDGNFVLYGSSSGALRHTQTNGSGADRVALQTDGNLVVYAGATPRWALSWWTSNTGAGANFMVKP